MGSNPIRETSYLARIKKLPHSKRYGGKFMRTEIITGLLALLIWSLATLYIVLQLPDAVLILTSCMSVGLGVYVVLKYLFIL